MEQCYEYASENDTKEFIETLTQLEKWFEELDDIEQERAMIAAKEWERENTHKMKCVRKYGRTVL
jgi:hypothetical protein